MSGRINPPLPDRSRAFARELRQASTDAEARLWERLRSSRLAGYKFRRQHPVPPYVVDFFCASGKIVVELDGSQYSHSADAERTRYLLSIGMEVLRFWDNDVLLRLEEVLAEILASIDARTLTPTPLPEGEGLKQKG